MDRNCNSTMEGVRPRRNRLAWMLVSLALAWLPGALHAASITLAWDPVPNTNVVAYRLYSGFASRTYQSVTNVGLATRVSLTNLTGGATYFFAVTAESSAGFESVYSKEVTAVMPSVTNTIPVTKAPTLSVVTNQTVAEDTTSTFTFSVSDLDTPLSNLVVYASSSNPSLLPIANLLISGGGSNLVLRATPATNAFGAAYLKIFVTDGVNTNSRGFTLTVSSENDAPTIAPLANLKLAPGQVSAVIPLGVTDVDSPASNLWVTATSSRPDLIPDANLLVNNNPTNKTLRVVAPVGALGLSTITVTASDGQASQSRTFDVSIESPNTPPVVTLAAPSSGFVGTAVRFSATVTDDGVPLDGIPMLAWTVVSGPGSVLMTGPATLVNDVTFQVSGNYWLRLTASDGALSTSVDQLINVVQYLDRQAPTVLGMRVTEVSASAISLQWSTDEPAQCELTWGLEGGAVTNLTVVTPGFATTHQVEITGLEAGKLHGLQVVARDLSGNEMKSTSTRVRTLKSVRFLKPLLITEAKLTSPMALGTDSTGTRLMRSWTPNSGRAVFSFDIPHGSTYAAWVRVYARNAASDTFLVGLDSAPGELFDSGQGGWAYAWQWVPLTSRTTAGIRPLQMDRGPHSLTFSCVEAGASLSHVLLSNDPDFVPSDTTPILGLRLPTQLTSSLLQEDLPPGWSITGYPFSSLQAGDGFNIMNPVAGTELDKYTGPEQQPVVGFHDGVEWSPWVGLNWREGGFLFNPGPAPLTIAMSGGPGDPAQPQTLYIGENLFVPSTPSEGVLSDLAGVSFVIGDSVLWSDPSGGTYQTSTLTDRGWDIVPTLSLGEAVIINLVPR